MTPTPAQIKSTYNRILSDIKSQGYRVIHRKLDSETAGLYDPDSDCITINTRVRWTLEGCFVLCHEFQHGLQRRYNEYPEFFKLDGTQPYSKRLMRIVIAAECGASRKAVKVLKTYGLKWISEDLTVKGLKQCIRYWRAHYFAPDKPGTRGSDLTGIQH